MRVTILLFSLLLAAPASAQPRARKESVFYAGTEKPAQVQPPSRRAALPQPREVALGALSEAQVAAFRQMGTPLRVGLHRELPADALASSSWHTTPEGERTWRLTLRSEGAAALRVRFAEFSVGDGRVWVHGGDEVAGPYTGQGPFGDGQFWSDAIASDSITVEYVPEPERDGDAPLPFEIATVSHRVDTATEPADPAAGCHLDPNCFAEWRDSMKTVAHIVFEEGTDEYVCSGSLVATRDNNLKPFFLTAGHCIHDEPAARSVQAYWTYQTSACGGARPFRKDSLKSSAGAHLLSSGAISQGDYSLLLLRDVPGGVWFAGWDPTDPPLGAQLVGIHHPAGSHKRISFGHRVSDQSVIVEDSLAPGNEFYEVVWDKGRVEPGSSGSPLFSGPGVVVGVLTYGSFSPTESVCELSSQLAGYGRFAVAYPVLRDYLEDLPASTVVPSPGSLRFSVANGAAARQSVTLNTQSANPVIFKARADASWIKVSAISGQTSAGSPATLAISVDPAYLTRPGTFTGTVTITSGASDPQYLNVRADVTVARSNVVVTFAPNPVLEQPADADGSRWFFKIRLDEKAGAATRLTTLRINGTDYSGSLKSWFGSDLLNAMGSLEAALRASGPAGDQYFEFGGVDEASQQRWYQPVTLLFAAPQR